MSRPDRRAAGRTTEPPRWGRARAREDGGAGLISSLAGLLAFLALLLFAVQTLVALHTRSAVTDAAYEGARAVAGARVDHSDPSAVAAAELDAEAKVRGLLGRFGESVQLDWSGTTTERVSLRVRARPPGFLWDALRGPGTAVVDRTVQVRVEELR